jgi:uracil-DNA glycosylase
MSSDWAVSALKWWSDAGVDVIVGEEPRDWLNPKPKKAVEAVPAPAAGAPLPASLAEFQAWLLAAEDLPYAAPSAPRLGPAGDGSSGLMVLTDVPAIEDFAAGKLISSQGLFDKMLAETSKKTGLKLDRETVYVASLSPLRPPSGNLDAANAGKLAEIARHHIVLAAPRALLLLGDACAKLFIGGPVAHTRSKWHEIETNGGKFRALVTMKPEKLNQQPNLKKHAWADLQLLKEGLTE